jgi:putative heme transporter
MSAAGRGVAGRRCRLVLEAVVAVGVVVAVASQRASLLSASARLGRVSPAWLALAVGAETASYLAAAELQHHLLAGAGVRVSRRSLVALTYAGTAISATLPAGPAVSSRYTFRSLQRRGTTPVTAAWVLAASAVLSTVALAVLGLVGAQLRGVGMLCSGVRGIVGVAVLLGAAGALAALVWAGRRPGRIEQLAAAVSARCNAALRLAARCVGHAARRAQTDRTTVSWLSEDPGETTGHLMGPARVAVALGLATINWVADIVALAVAFVALGLDVPWQGLLLAYALTQVATSVPLLPGSLGVAEGSMAGALVCAGVHPTAALAGVLVYRLVSFWLVLPTGWLAWMCLRRDEARLPVLESEPCRPCPTVALV